MEVRPKSNNRKNISASTRTKHVTAIVGKFINFFFFLNEAGHAVVLVSV